MGRLIDVADLEKFIQEHRCVIGDDNLLLVAADDGRWQEVLPLVKTAYDVDKVVATMDEALIELEDGTNCGTCVLKKVCDDGYDGCIQTIVAVCKSIVKAGGNIELPEHSESQGD